MLRRTPLKAKTKLKAKKPLNRKSKRKKLYDAEFEAIKPQVKKRDGYR